MIKKSTVTCVFVDFDGTLINSIDSLYKSYCQFLGLYLIEGNKDEFNALNGPSTLEIVEILRAKHRLSQQVTDCYSKYIEIIKTNYNNSEAFSDSEIFLSSLHLQGKKLVLVTSSRAENCLPLIEKFKWKKYFSDLVWGEDVKHSKPSPDIYLEAYRRMGVQKNNIIVIEDSLNGVRAAHAAGLVAWGLAIDFSEDDLKGAGATKVFKNLTHVLEEFSDTKLASPGDGAGSGSPKNRQGSENLDSG